jgi:UDP-N-acetylglucosamine 1-carboxyvinyltransferase
MMDRIRIVGGRRLEGTIPISGAKNATLPLMIASLLTKDTLILDNVPRLADVNLLQRILGNHGVDIMVGGKRPGGKLDDGQTLHISAANIVDTTAPYELVSKMRASFWVLAPLVARMGEARVSMPGGCAIGTRPVDLLIMAMARLGAAIEIDGGFVVARAPHGLRGAEIVFPKVTVGGTHTALMAATLADGTTVIENAAREPEVVDVADCLNKMGARISGAGTRRIVVDGVAKLNGTRHSVLPDRIETGTYAMAVAMTGGDVFLQNTRADLLQSALDVLTRTGTAVTPTNQGIRIARNGADLAPVDVSTAPFPEFPTDLQAQLMALMTRARGTSQIVETIFENRFMHVQELVRLGARIQLQGERATIEGVERLTGAPVMATDLRASVSLVIAALAAEGETFVNRVYHLDRGFERLEEKLGRCGAAIERLSG